MYFQINTINRINAAIAGVILILFTANSCALFQPIEEPVPHFEEEEWIIPDGPVQTLRELTWDLHHQKLWVRFDFEEESVIGRTEMLFTSEKRQSGLVLDAKTMELDSIYDVTSGEIYSFEQDSAVVTVSFDRSFDEGDTLVLGVDFASTPPQRGLYFVNPRGEDPVKPTQVWTLGQPEDNSFWFPTIDHPAERTTQETWISVPPEYTTMSNGLLMESRQAEGDSLRTDYWRLHQPHAPYLFALAVGKYEVTEEIRGDILYRYYTEPQYAEAVDLIFENTVDMIRFSENKTGVAYPWDPVYSQAPVHDFIARGMENTTATILYDAVQSDRRTAEDLSHQDLIMHEIIHQWLGNLVTAENWANLPLNEGFANYFEAAYRLHNNGRDSYLWKSQNDRLLYFNEADRYRRPVIFDRYQIPEDMYDRHTYQKAGQILRMLHEYLGDEVWWEGVNKWLEKFSYDAANIHDLQEVYENVSGEDLDWFFTQWFLQPGHPYLEISQGITENQAYIRITQVQDTTRQPVFQLYPDVLLELEEGSQTERIEITDVDEEFHFEADQRIRDVIVDPDRVQLAQYFITTDVSRLVSRLDSENLLVRTESMSLLSEEMEDNNVQERISELALNDAFWGVRMQAYELLANHAEFLPDEELLSLSKNAIRENEKHYQVRRESLGLLYGVDIDDVALRENVREHLYKMMDDASYFVAAEAMRVAGDLFPGDAASMVNAYAGIDSYQDVIKQAVTDVLIHVDMETGSEEAREILFMLADERGDKSYSYDALNHIAGRILEINENEYKRIEPLFADRLDDPYKRFRMLAYEALVDMRATDQIEALNRIREQRRIDDQERREIRNAIRALEYELKINE